MALPKLPTATNNLQQWIRDCAAAVNRLINAGGGTSIGGGALQFIGDWAAPSAPDGVFVSPVVGAWT